VGSRYIIDIKLAVSLQKQKSTYTPAGVHPNYVGQCKVLWFQFSGAVQNRTSATLIYINGYFVPPLVRPKIHREEQGFGKSMTHSQLAHSDPQVTIIKRR
jgi:hypothetical protein